jgi:hypothetical protein
MPNSPDDMGGTSITSNGNSASFESSPRSGPSRSASLRVRGLSGPRVTFSDTHNVCRWGCYSICNTCILYSKITVTFLNDGSTGVSPLQNICGQTWPSDFTLFFHRRKRKFLKKVCCTQWARPLFFFHYFFFVVHNTTFTWM